MDRDDVGRVGGAEAPAGGDEVVALREVLREAFETALAASAAGAAATPPFPPGLEAGLREDLAAQLERLHPQATMRARHAVGMARSVATARVAFVDGPLTGSAVTVGLARAVLEPLAPARLVHLVGRGTPPEGTVAVEGRAAEALDLLAADVAARRARDGALRERFAAWSSSGAATLAGMRAAFPEIAGYVASAPAGPTRH